MLSWKKIPYILVATAMFVACSNSSSSSSAADEDDCSSSSGLTSSASNEDDTSSSSFDLVGDTFTDARDGQTYKVVTIGSQIWMAENLNYETEGSFCYMDIDSNCTKYGRLYKWYAAMDSAGTFSASGKGCGYGSMCKPTGTTRGICPEGWHLPDSTEWHNLIKAAKAAGGKDAAGKALLSTTGWDNDLNGTNHFGFSALPGGERDRGEYSGEGRRSYFWTSTEYNTNTAVNIRMSNVGASYSHEEKYIGESIRCVYDIAAPESPSSETSSSSEVPFTDSRDGQTYRTVTIGSQIWMAENLNYKVDGSRCYGDSIENCTKYGRYYTWEAALEACPQGWHLPNEREWDALLDFSSATDLQSTTGWAKDGGEYGCDFNGTDYYGFTALPSRPNGTDAKFWSSTEFPGRCIDKDSIHALYAKIYSTEPVPVMTTGMMCGSQDQFFPIRCISNESQTPQDSSTASPAVPPCKTDSTDNCEYGTLKDDRDGQTYKTVKIGSQEWMAENLEYKTDSSYCSREGCSKYGRYYTWEDALKACPEGWHLPDSTEWATLRESVGKDAAKALKSTTDWRSNSALTNPSYYCGTAYIDLVGTDSYGFAVLPAGTIGENDVVRSQIEAWFWTKTEAYHWRSPEPPTSFANVAVFQGGMGIGGLESKSEKFSVRCIKD